MTSITPHDDSRQVNSTIEYLVNWFRDEMLLKTWRFDDQDAMIEFTTKKFGKIMWRCRSTQRKFWDAEIDRRDNVTAQAIDRTTADAAGGGS